MKITIKTTTLQGMLSKAVKGASDDKMIPITTYMCIKCEKDVLTIITTDETNYLYVMDDTVKGDGFYVVVKVEQFSKLISRLTSDDVSLEVKGNSLEVKANGTYAIGLDDDYGNPIEYPDPLSEVEFEATDSIKLTDIKTILGNIKPSLLAPSAGNQGSIYTYCYVGNSVMATNNTKGAMYDKQLFNDELLLSRDVLDLLDVVTDEVIDVMIDDDSMIFHSTDCIIYSTRLGGVEEYPANELLALFTEDVESSCKVNRDAFLALLDRMNLFVGVFDENVIRLTFTDEGILVNNLDSNSEEIIDYIGSKNHKSFTCLLDVEELVTQIKAYSSNTIEMYYGSDISLKFVDGDVIQLVAFKQE